jgi:hypothetical protein
LGASLASLKTLAVVNEYFSPSDVRLSLNRRDILLSTASGVVLFRAWGGRFGAVLPSNLMRPGAFAAEWIPALRESEAASPKEREVIKVLGQRYGCHSCGEKKGVDFVADHQPPSRLLGNHRNGGAKAPRSNPLLQRFYPQCMRCSRTQGGVLGGGNGNSLTHPKAIMTHSTSFQPHHIFLPLPFFIAYLTETGKGLRKQIIPDDLEAREIPSGERTKPLSAVKSSGKEEKAEAAEMARTVQAKDANSPQDKVKQKPKAKEKASPKVKSAKVEAEVENTEQKTADNSWLDMDVALDFPLLIVWRKLMLFLDSFANPLTSFHITLWMFTIIAAMGTV